MHENNRELTSTHNKRRRNKCGQYKRKRTHIQRKLKLWCISLFKMSIYRNRIYSSIPRSRFSTWPKCVQKKKKKDSEKNQISNHSHKLNVRFSNLLCVPCWCVHFFVRSLFSFEYSSPALFLCLSLSLDLRLFPVQFVVCTQFILYLQLIFLLSSSTIFLLFHHNHRKSNPTLILYYDTFSTLIFLIELFSSSSSSSTLSCSFLAHTNSFNSLSCGVVYRCFSSVCSKHARKRERHTVSYVYILSEGVLNE